jgi:hypothetical protein
MVYKSPDTESTQIQKAIDFLVLKYPRQEDMFYNESHVYLLYRLYPMCILCNIAKRQDNIFF